MARDTWKPRRVHTRTVYFKLQIFDNNSLTWRDEKHQFATIEDVELYLKEKHLSIKKWRIVEVDGKNRKVIQITPD